MNSVKVKKSIVEQITFKDLLTKQKTGKESFDFYKIKKAFDDYNIFIILSQRGSLAKTTQAKELARIEFLKNKRPSVFLRNTGAAIEREMKKFLDPNTLKVNDFYKEAKIKGNMAYYKGKP